jgi:DNA polymerase-3 subunit alpha
MALRIFLRDDKPVESIAKRLESVAIKAGGNGASSKSDGDVTLIMLLDPQTEVEMRLPGRFKVSPQIAGAIKAVPGVVQVEVI